MVMTRDEIKNTLAEADYLAHKILSKDQYGDARILSALVRLAVKGIEELLPEKRSDTCCAEACAGLRDIITKKDLLIDELRQQLDSKQ